MWRCRDGCCVADLEVAGTPLNSSARNFKKLNLQFGDHIGDEISPILMNRAEKAHYKSEKVMSENEKVML